MAPSRDQCLTVPRTGQPRRATCPPTVPACPSRRSRQGPWTPSQGYSPPGRLPCLLFLRTPHSSVGRALRHRGEGTGDLRGPVLRGLGGNRSEIHCDRCSKCSRGFREWPESRAFGTAAPRPRPPPAETPSQVRASGGGGLPAGRTGTRGQRAQRFRPLCSPSSDPARPPAPPRPPE